MKTLLLLSLCALGFHYTPGQTCTATITAGGPTSFCGGGSVELSANFNEVGWSRKANFQGSGRNMSVGLSILNKGYIGTGNINAGTSNSLLKDFWEFEPISNTWTQKADFGGIARGWAIGFSIGTKGYIGTGNTSGGLSNDFWEYDPVANSWKRKADFAGTSRGGATGFSIGNKGYLACGFDGSLMKNDLWEYDPFLDQWTKKMDFPGTPRQNATAFAIVGKGYLGMGLARTNTVLGGTKDFWEYDPAIDQWNQKTNFGGIATTAAIGFSIQNKGYIGSGFNNTIDNFWEFDPVKNTWVKKQDFNSTGPAATGFSIGNKGYIGLVQDIYGFHTDFYQYDPTITNTYLWSTGETTPSITVSTSGSYTVIVTNSSGCSATSAPVVVNNNVLPSPIIAPSGPTTFCQGGNVVLSAGTAGDTWTQKANFGGVARANAISFNIGDKGFIGMGKSLRFPYSTYNDFWEFEPDKNTWTQKANFGGAPRQLATGFSIGTKGYVGTGRDFTTTPSTYYKDLWEYDPVSNSWTQKADFGGTARHMATGFSIGNKGYLGTGTDLNDIWHNDLWEYNPATDTWLQKASFGLLGRSGALGFTIEGKGYIGLGTFFIAPYANLTRDFWEYDPVSDSWLQKADFKGIARQGSVGLSIGGKGYVGTGGDGSKRNDFWEYDPVVNNWTQKINFGGTPRFHATGFSINGKGYIGTGFDNNNLNKNDFWEYSPASYTYSWSSGETTPSITVSTSGSYTVTLTNSLGCSATSAPTTVILEPQPPTNIIAGGPTTFCQGGSVILSVNAGGNGWKRKANYPGAGREKAVGFSIGNKGYVGTGANLRIQKDFWEYDPVTNIWTQKADFGGGPRFGATGFNIGNKGFLGLGGMPDFWEYDPLSNNWTQKADFGGTARTNAVGFSIGDKGYIGTGGSATPLNDFWEYDPKTDKWNQKADFGGLGRFGAVGFSIGDKGYIGKGEGYFINNTSTTYASDFWEYNPSLNSWVQKATIPGGGTSYSTGFSLMGKGYIGMGGFTSDFYEYDTSANAWSRIDGFGNGQTAISFAINNKGYAGIGVDNGPKNDFWEFGPQNNYNYLWSTGATTPSITVAKGGNYTVTVTSSAGCSAISPPTVVAISTLPKPTIRPYGPTTFCPGKNVILYADPITNPWSRIGFPGITREFGVGFNIGNKGYIGTGSGKNSLLKDFWEYDPATKTWMQKAEFKGTARFGASGFSVNGKGYLGLGLDNPQFGYKKDFWEFDPVANSWKQMEDFGGDPRSHAVCFSIGNKGYAGTGRGLNNTYKKDFWEFDPLGGNSGKGTWTKKADFTGTARQAATGFNIDGNGYIGTGYDGTFSYKKDFYEYNPSGGTSGTGAWSRKADFPGTARQFAAGFDIDNKGYIGTGLDVNGDYKNDFYEFDPATNRWKKFDGLGTISGRSGATSFSMNGKGFVGLGSNNYSDFWVYEPAKILTYLWSTGTTVPFVIASKSGSYTVTITTSTGCSATSAPTVVTAVCPAVPKFTNPAENTRISVFPNPSNGQFTLQLINIKAADGMVSILDAKGSVIERSTLKKASFVNTLSFSLGNNARGVYTVKVETDQGIQTAQVILQ